MRLRQTTLLNFLHNENGATAIEYALIASGVAGAIVTIVTTLGVSVQTMYQSIADIFN